MNRSRLSLLALAAACAGAPKTPPAEVGAEAPPEPAAEVVPEPAPAATPAATEQIGGIAVSPLYHGTVALDLGGKTWIVDPWTKAPLDGRKAAVVLVTDIHPDHLDPAAIDAVKTDGTVVVGPQAVADKVHVDIVIANGETKEIGGAQVTAVPMYNLVRGPAPDQKFHDKGRGNGYVIRVPAASGGEDSVYIAGDTECTDEMKALTGIDVAFVPMNLPYTMTPDEAAVCIKAFAPTVVYPYHYGDSDLSGLAAAVGAGVDVRIREWYPGGLPF